MLDKLNFISYILMSAALVHFYGKCINSAQLEHTLDESILSYREKAERFFSNTHLWLSFLDQTVSNKGFNITL